MYHLDVLNIKKFVDLHLSGHCFLGWPQMAVKSGLAIASSASVENTAHGDRKYVLDELAVLDRRTDLRSGHMENPSPSPHAHANRWIYSDPTGPQS